MTNSQAIVQLDKSEEYFVVELKKKNLRRSFAVF